METIISAVISAAAAIIVCVINQNRLVSLIEYRLEQLEEKQDKYNNVIVRTYELEKKEEIAQVEMGNMKHQIEHLEKYHEPTN